MTSPASSQAAETVKASEEYPDFYSGDTTKGIDFVKSIQVLAPEYCSSVKGDFTVVFKAPGMKFVKAFCWQQPTQDKPGPRGHDMLVADLGLGADAAGSFVFKADAFPNGPLTIRILAKDDKNKQDICELQLFNLGGVVWNQGVPKKDPPGAAGMKLVFADDFDGPLSISPSGMNARYSAHKTGGGDFSGWQIDMERYGNKTDMWVDFVRVYSGCIQMPEIVIDGFPGAKPATATLTTVTAGAPVHYTLDDTEPTEQSPLYRGPVSISKPCTVKAKAFGKGLKPSPAAQRIVSAAPGVAGSIGVNFVTAAGGDQALEPNDVAGIGAEAQQGNWNAVAADAKTASGNEIHAHLIARRLPTSRRGWKRIRSPPRVPLQIR
jgi:hypothetical protein